MAVAMEWGFDKDPENEIFSKSSDLPCGMLSNGHIPLLQRCLVRIDVHSGVSKDGESLRILLELIENQDKKMHNICKQMC